MSVYALSNWRECNELHCIGGLQPVGLPHWGMQVITGTANFSRNFPPMSAAGTRQHPHQGARKIMFVLIDTCLTVL
jgi:hypothetical protein